MTARVRSMTWGELVKQFYFPDAGQQRSRTDALRFEIQRRVAAAIQ